MDGLNVAGSKYNICLYIYVYSRLSSLPSTDISGKDVCETLLRKGHVKVGYQMTGNR